MTEHDLPLDDLKQLAEQEIEDKREDSGSEADAGELYDLPTEPPSQLAHQQDEQGSP